MPIMPKRRLPAARPCIACGAIALLLLSPGGLAQDAAEPISPAVSETLPAWVEGLDSEGLAERDRASAELASAIFACDLSALPHVSRLVESTLAGLAERSELSIEQRRRIVTALRERFMRSPRAAMGISFGPRADAGVEVRELTPGFPVRELGLLEAGDVIVEIAGEPVEESANRQTRQERLRELIVSHDPGEQVRLKVLRPTTPRQMRDAVREADQQQGVREPPLVVDGPNANAIALEVVVPLGDYTKLGDRAMALTTSVLDTAWQFRARRLGLSDAPTTMLETTVSPAAWRRPERRVRRPEEPGIVIEGALADAALDADDRAFLAQAARRGRNVRLQEPIVIQGGAVIIRGGEGVVIQQRPNRPALVVRRQPDQPPPAPVQAKAVAPAAPDPALEFATIQRRISMIEEAIAEHERRVADLQTSEDSRRKSLAYLVSLREEMAARERERDALREKLAIPFEKPAKAPEE